MKVPVSWLKDYVDVGTVTVEELTERLTLAGLEVEKVHYVGVPGAELVWDRDKILVGRVLAVDRHPNADRLLLATVEYGADSPITVVTGAPNLAPGMSGQKVVLALKGARLYDGHKEGKVLMTLKEATLRGIKNDAMVCSEKELGLSEEHEGILILPDDAPVGAPLQGYLGDAVLDIAILPSTARCASIIGVAREAAAVLGAPLRYPPTDYTESEERAEDQIALSITDPKLNPRFTAAVITGVRQMPSPFWMQRRLQLVGMRPINNVVDISNYVMMETGQPTHAFDFGRVTTQPDGRKHVLTRLAAPGETMVTLDGKAHELLPTDVLVCEPGRALSIAGVMGGLDSEIKDDTTDILHEVASWELVSIRRTARHHNFNSEASYRFARGVHPELTMLAQRRFLHLLQRYGGGAISRGIVDAYPLPAPVVVVDLNPADVNRLLGVTVATDDMARILESLEFAVERLGDELRVTVPQHRLDVEGWHDLAEEIARIYGYDNIPATLMMDEIPPATGNPALEFEDRVKDALVNAGLQEVVSYRLTLPEREMKAYAPGTPPDDRAYVTVVNPINPDRAVMRHALAAGLLETVALNLRHRESASIFEVGAVYVPSEEGVLPDELPRLGIALAGPSTARSWHAAGDGQPRDFYDLKGVLDSLFADLDLAVEYVPGSHPTFYPGRTAELRVAGRRAGVAGEVHPQVRGSFGITTAVIMADLDLAALRDAAREHTQTIDVPRFPAVVEDLAVVVDDGMPAAQVEQAIRRAGGPLLRSATVFDVYRGESIGAGKKSLAYSLTYLADDRTLSDADVEKVRNKIIRTLEGQLGAVVRK